MGETEPEPIGALALAPAATDSKEFDPESARVVTLMLSVSPIVKAAMNAASPITLLTCMVPKNFGVGVPSCKKEKVTVPVRRSPAGIL